MEKLIFNLKPDYLYFNLTKFVPILFALLLVGCDANTSSYSKLENLDANVTNDSLDALSRDLSPHSFDRFGLYFEYAEPWKIFSSEAYDKTGVFTILSIPGTQDVVNIQRYPVSETADLKSLTKNYDLFNSTPVYEGPQPNPQWYEIERVGHKGYRKIEDTHGKYFKPYVNEYYRIQVGDQAVLVVVHSNRKNIGKIGPELKLLLNSLRASS